MIQVLSDKPGRCCRQIGVLGVIQGLFRRLEGRHILLSDVVFDNFLIAIVSYAESQVIPALLRSLPNDPHN